MPSRRFSLTEIRELATHFVRRTVANIFTASIDISYGGTTLTIGADNGLSTRTNATNKIGRFAVVHYTNAEEPVALVFGSITATDNIVFVGGGTGTLNAATEIRFFTGATTTTNTGIERMEIDSAGHVGIGVNTPTAMLHLKAGTSTANTAPLKLTAGTNLTTPEDGAFEYSGGVLYFTVGGVRKTVTLV
jgi:hypothetical protein